MANELAPARWPWLDGLRGLAIAGMAIYHLTWDLTFFHFIEPSVLRTPGFVLFGHVIACSFLAIAGFALAIASCPQLDVRKFGFRFAKIMAAAALVTLVTYFIFPGSYVTFGILHCIAAASIMSFAFIRRPWWTGALAGAVVFAAGVFVEMPLFDSVNGWIGLGERIPLTNDWRPLFPWAGAMLLGLASGQFVLTRGTLANFDGPLKGTRLFNWLALAGRYSLSIYLIHQPLLFALVWFPAQVLQPQALPVISPESFNRACEARCTASGADAGFCARACGCITKSALTADLWNNLTRGQFSEREQQRYDEIVTICRGAASAAR